uniref:NADH-ubiquinone oxidoreductase chain 4 n=1 Tax=Halocynthia spinosa TaxID=569430 RepID=S0DG88_HALSF|nr:NADH dehydrogenase subunit 4 [Halocynthia spinosa]CCO25772.1 NADH dehydrogenase subunit 4 [Halocynthia spinosa]
MLVAFCVFMYGVLTGFSTRFGLYWGAVYVLFVGLLKGLVGVMMTGEVCGVGQCYPISFDFLAVSFLVLSLWVIFLGVWAGLGHLSFGLRIYVGLFNVLMVVLFLFFGVGNFLLFFLFFEGSLLPMFVILGVWGAQPERIFANYYFFLYTIMGGFPLLVFILVGHGDWISGMCLFYYGELIVVESLVFFVLLLAFMCKLPLFGFHLWLPKAHVEAPVGGSIVLAGLLLKLGGFGLLRVVCLMYVESGVFYYLLMAMGVWGMFVCGFLCLRQVDIKSMIAYSSVAHMSLCLSGGVSFLWFGYKGLLMLSLAHGLVSPALFGLGNYMYERIGSRVVLSTGANQHGFYSFSFFFLFFLACNFGFPPSLSFFGELLLYFGLMQWGFFLFLMLGLGMVLMGLVMLKLFVKVFYSIGEGFIIKGGSYREVLLMWLLLVLMFLVSVFLIY